MLPFVFSTPANAEKDDAKRERKKRGQKNWLRGGENNAKAAEMEDVEEYRKKERVLV